jgi:hypothetical protein
MPSQSARQQQGKQRSVAFAFDADNQVLARAIVLVRLSARFPAVRQVFSLLSHAL